MSATTNNSDVSHDPYLVEIDDELHPAWARLRDEAPLHRIRNSTSRR